MVAHAHAHRLAHPTHVHAHSRSSNAHPALPGTGRAYGATSLRACYAKPGTDLAYAVVSAYARATQSPVLT
eukprot:3940922-Rhodomonas_salina.4